MIDIQKLKGKMVEKNYTQNSLAEALDITPRTLSNKLRRGIFNNLEIQKMVELLEIEKPLEIFFVNNLTQNDKRKK